MARHYVKTPRTMFRAALDLSPAARVQLAKLLSITAARAGAGVPLTSARPVIGVLAALASSAAGTRAADEGHPAAHLLPIVQAAWEKHAGWTPPLVPSGRW
jgi:hypothetical protein